MGGPLKCSAIDVNILCFIDSLGCGGAQRQLTMIAVGLKKRGHSVRFLVYHPHDHFLPVLQDAGIPCQVVPPCSHWQRALAVRRILRQGWQDVVLAFLPTSCLYAELARIPGRQWGLVAGERSSNPEMMTGFGRWLRQFHRWADSVVCNSHTNRLMLEAGFPFLKKKLTTVYNMVDLQVFRPTWTESAVAGNSNREPCRIVVAGSYQELKNMEGVAKALLQIRKCPATHRIVIDWYGGMATEPTPYHRAARFIAEHELGSDFRLHPPTKMIGVEFATASAIGLFSFFEGMPNAVCEGMASGKPIVLSDVCDADSLVKDGKNGFLCDPSSAESIANAIGRLAALSDQERGQMGLESRKIAEHLFAQDVVIERYERILKAAARRARISADCTWPAEVPESAVRTVEQWTNGSQERWE